MGERPDLIERCAGAWMIGVETLRFFFSELRAGHTGTYGFQGYQFLANQLLTDRYSPRKKRVVAEFVAHSARKNGDSQALQIALDALQSSNNRLQRTGEE
jgi:hypothetical protein